MLSVDDPDARERLVAALGVRRWAYDVAAAGPFEDVDDLVRAAEGTARLTDAELEEAVRSHPRIGEKPTADGDAGRLSAAEQAGLDRADEGFDAAMLRGNRVYEERFGRVFLIRAAGRSPQEILDELQRRMTNDPDEEAAEAKQQLVEIGLGRLRTLFGRGES